MESKTSRKKYSSCHVPQCSKDPNASMHLIPCQSRNEKKNLIRKQWMTILNLDPTEDTVYYVCSNHFSQNDFKERRAGTGKTRLKNDAVPSVNLPSLSAKKNSDSDEVPNGSDDKGPLVNTEDSHNNTDELGPHKHDDENHNDAAHKKKEELEENQENQELLYECFYIDLNFQDIDEVEESYVSQADVSIQTNLAYDESLRKVTLLDMFKNTEDLMTWTGIPNFDVLDNINFCVNNLSSAAEQIAKFRTTTENLIIIVMTKLRTNLFFRQMSVLFGVATKTLIKYFFGFVPILKAVLECVLFWPSKEEVAANMPNCFKENFSDCMAIMDCTEAPIERLKYLDSRIKCFSHYKGTHTVKINITTTPSGLIMNLSSAWGGKASDKHIIMQEKILEKFSVDDGLMVDKGYNISAETKAKGIKLYRPPILDKPQFTSEEAVENTTIAKARIHVERVIQRIKQWKIFQSKISKTMLKVIDDIVVICCAMVNLSPPILASDKF